MVIAVEVGLEETSRKLKERGYTIVSYPEYAGVVDAFICKDNIPNNMGVFQDNEIDSPLESYAYSKQHGILIINATNKSISQIEDILETRVYSPLF